MDDTRGCVTKVPTKEPSSEVSAVLRREAEQLLRDVGAACVDTRKRSDIAACAHCSAQVDKIEAFVRRQRAQAPKLPCTCGPPSFPYQEHDGDCPRGLAEAEPSAPAGLRHSLTMEFRRILSEAEWREVAEKARKLPYVQGLTANAAGAEDTP